VIHCQRYVANFKRKLSKVAKRIGRGRINSPHGARIHQTAYAILDILDKTDIGEMVMAAADKIPVTSRGHGTCVMGIVDKKDAAAREFETRILTIIADNAPGSLGNSAHHVQIPCIVPMDYVYRQAKLL